MTEIPMSKHQKIDPIDLSDVVGNATNYHVIRNPFQADTTKKVIGSTPKHLFVGRLDVPALAGSVPETVATVLADSGWSTYRAPQPHMPRPRPNKLLREILSDLQTVVQEAGEEDFPVPNRSAIDTAEQLLSEVYEARWLYVSPPSRAEVYPTPDGEVAIDISGGFGRSFLVLCNSSGGAMCMLNLRGEHRRAVYDKAPTSMDGFIRDALRDLFRSS